MLFKYQYVKTYFIWDLMKIWKLTVEMINMVGIKIGKCLEKKI